VAYPLLDLRRLGIGVKALVERIEQAVIDTCAAAGIATVRREGAPGVYTADGAKIAALGLRVRRGCSFHGLAFNVDMDLEPFQRINPCGYAGQPVTMLAAHGGPAGLRTVAELLVPRLSSHLGLRPAWQDGAIPGL
jgi:lipoyl(octanoyl) transferase